MFLPLKLNVSALLALVCLTGIWGYGWIVMKSVLPYVGAFDFAAMRCSLGAVLLLLVLKVRNRGMKPPPLLPTFIIGLLQTAGMVGFSQWALVNGGAGKVAILTYTMPFWVILMAALFLKERLRKVQYLATGIAVCGMVLILQPWKINSGIIGSLLALCSGFSGGKRHLRQAPVHSLSNRPAVADHLADGVGSAGAGGYCVCDTQSPYRMASLHVGWSAV